MAPPDLASLIGEELDAAVRDSSANAAANGRGLDALDVPAARGVPARAGTEITWLRREPPSATSDLAQGSDNEENDALVISTIHSKSVGRVSLEHSSDQICTQTTGE